MYQELVVILKQLDEYYIKNLLLNIVSDAEIKRRLLTWQAGKTIHHAYQSGLLEHILSCVKLGMSLSTHYKTNTSYVVAGCLLHDLCKIYELSDGATVDYTEEGKLVGHLVKGVELLDRFIYKMGPDFPYDQRLHLKHILLSHHGKYEYGSPKIPQTSEAMLVHLIDLMDSKMASFDEVKKKDQTVGHWTQFIKHLDCIVYKAELPSYKKPVNANSSKVEPVVKKSNGDLKQSLGDKLKDFKL
jgi:3'-5' exoribonuclease